jgi:hypothetical protein
MGVICDICSEDMATSSSCTEPQIDLAGESFERVRYGSEEDDWGAASGARCHDCNVEPGGLHHLGCDVERCPRCGGQLIACDCGD